ncbi:hypothetical protein C9F11_38365 [Streptomyces sp. YIM 121038]|nr:hypothetical protein C9F11_38365 [Streptomyces sp. YIM 121038]
MNETWPSLLAALAVLSIAITTGWFIGPLIDKIRRSRRPRARS